MILSLETATDFPCMALGTPDDPGEDVRLADRRALSREIERMVAGLLESRGLAVRALTGVLVADGPGCFTGLRIGAAFAKGLCRVLGVPLLTAPSLLGAAARAAAAARRSPPLEVVARYDALRGECYRAVYRIGIGGTEVLAPPTLVPAGSGTEGVGARALAATEHDASAAALLSLVGRAGGPVPVADPHAWQPAYGRPAEAEARRLASEHGGKAR